MLSEYGSFVASCWPSLLLTAACAYLLGSLNFAIIITRLFAKTDIRDSGSGNAGATNVLRSQGPLPAVLTTAGDLAKSVAAVLLGRWLMGAMNGDFTAGSDADVALIGAYLAGLFCILGHLFPLFFGFRGGKGVLTTLGMMLVLDWRAALICLGLFIVVVLASRMVSLGSVCAAAALPVFTYLFSALVDRNRLSDTVFVTTMTVFIAFILIVKHRSNLRRIANGTESKLSFGKKSA